MGSILHDSNATKKTQLWTKAVPFNLSHDLGLVLSIKGSQLLLVLLLILFHLLLIVKLLFILLLQEGVKLGFVYVQLSCELLSQSFRRC